MANYIYISIPIIDELVLFAEQVSEYEDAVKAISSSILVHYFPPLSGFSVVSEQNWNNHYANYIVLRIQCWFPGDRGIVDHTVVEAKKNRLIHWMHHLDNSKMRLRTQILSLDVVGHCWFEALSSCFMNIISTDPLTTVFFLGDLLISRDEIPTMCDMIQKLLTGCCDGWYSKTLHPPALNVKREHEKLWNTQSEVARKLCI